MSITTVHKCLGSEQISCWTFVWAYSCLTQNAPYSPSSKCPNVLLWLLIMCIMFVCLALFHSRRVFISNLQKEIEKQTGYRSSRKRRSESQYDYEVYHSLEEVDMKPKIYLPISHSPLLSNLLHPQGKHTTSLRVLSGSRLLGSTCVSPTASRFHTPRCALHFRHFTALECLFSQVDRAPGSQIFQAPWSTIAQGTNLCSFELPSSLSHIRRHTNVL